ncbi:MAG: ATP-binding protein [Ramlibacter sp.]
MTAFVRAWAAAALLAMLGSSVAAASCDTPTAIDRAQRIVSGAGPLDGVEPIALPDAMPLALRKEHVRISYEIDVSACAGVPAAALWLFRVGAPYRITSDGMPLELLNNHALLSPDLVSGRFPMALEGIHNGRMPGLFALPPGATKVRVELQTLPYFPSGIARSEVGPTNLMLPVQARTSDIVNAYIGEASVVLLVLGLIALLLGVTRRGDPGLLWLAAACGLWSLRGLLYFSHKVYVQPLAFEQFNSLNVLLTSGALSAAVLHLFGGIRRAEHAALAWGIGACLALYTASAYAQAGSTAVRALCLGASFVMVAWLLCRAWHGRANWRRSHMAILAAGLATLLACGVHDVLLLTGRLEPDAPSYLFWGFVVLLTGMAAVSGHYVVLTLNRAERSNEELELHVTRKTAELEHSYARLRESEHESARAQERERLLRDMHDGLGAQLMTALRGLERGALGPADVKRSLQDGLDELRMLMDSTDLGHYLPAVLAAWRNRWDARLLAAGVGLEWAVDESLDQVQLSSDTALQVMRILQEAAANIVKHSQAHRMTLDARVVAASPASLLRIVITDDGVGVPEEAARPGARGLKNMRHRAEQIGAVLVIARRHSQPGTQVSISLPVELPAGDAQATNPRLAASIAASARDEMPSLR